MTEMTFIDSHAHITSDELNDKVPDLLERAKLNQLEAIINICTDKKTLERGLELSKKCSWVYNAGATTPHDVEKEGELYFDMFSEKAKSNELVAVGETGLDYHYEHSKKSIQQEFLKRYLELAEKTKLPVIFHCREAFDDLFKICDSSMQECKAVLHCFTGTMDEAKEVISRGWYLSLSGIVTYKKSDDLRKVAKEVPLDQLLIETDSPYLAPQSMRGKINEPANIVETATVIAGCKGLELCEIAEATTRNAKQVFKGRFLS